MVCVFADRDINEVAVMRREIPEHCLDVDIFEIDQTRFAFIGDLFEDIDIGKQLVQVIVDALLSIRRQTGKQVDPSLYPSEVIFEFMPDRRRDIANKFVPPRNFLIFQDKQHVFTGPPLFLLVDNGQVHAEGGKRNDHDHKGVMRDPVGIIELPLHDCKTLVDAGIGRDQSLPRHQSQLKPVQGGDEPFCVHHDQKEPDNDQKDRQRQGLYFVRNIGIDHTG